MCVFVVGMLKVESVLLIPLVMPGLDHWEP